ncbi:LCCL domain-containing protein [Roseomonas rosulenta]|uniref:LCCL domain-containing protein n=1 Tax=Roseomonas rosulenta TaxID=2748667 RepID=UPI0018DFD97A|nr:LCCL domain-containing protein [Roseomonas rosulenta]
MRRFVLALGTVLFLAGPAAAQSPCPASFQGQTAPMTCACAPEAAVSGGVWGTGTYTTDSRICRAAVHAGAIPALGGVIVVTPAPGLPSYAGSAANGVTTSNYGPWSASFTVAAPAAATAACPDTFQNQAGALTCTCTTEAALSGSVWGTGTYTADSRICRAAIHAGAIPATGGVVTVTPAPGQQAYAGSAANGVTTSNYGPWSASFTVAAPGVQAAACPANFEGRNAPLSCSCTPDQAMSGSVWGTGIYTTDSRVCRAAVHAGVIPAAGGLVNVVPAPGQNAYAGSAANGITTSNYGPWGASFTFRR